MTRYGIIGLALLLSLAPATAPAAGSADAPKHAAKKFSVVFLDEHHKPRKEVVLNLDNPADRERLMTALAAGQVESVHAVHDVNLMAVSIDLGLWTIIVFVLLLLILKKAAWGPMLEGLRKREENINSALEEAKKARDDAQAIRAQLQKEMDHAAEKVRDLMDEARRDAKVMQNDMLAQARKEIQTDRERLHRELETAKDQALQEIWHQAAQLATLISVKTVRKQLSFSDHQLLVDEALNELKAAGAQRQREIAGI